MRKLHICGLVVVVLGARAAMGQEAPRSTLPPMRTAPADTPFPGATTVPPPMSPPTPKPDGRVSVHLKDGSRLVGKLVGLDKLKLKTSYGEVAAPLDALLGIRIHESANVAAGPGSDPTILFRNGDVLTAEPQWGTLKIETVWGEAAIAGKHVESIVMSPDRMAWVWDGRWHLVNESGVDTMTGASYASPYGPSGRPSGLRSSRGMMPSPAGSYGPPTTLTPPTVPAPAPRTP